MIDFFFNTIGAFCVGAMVIITLMAIVFAAGTILIWLFGALAHIVSYVIAGILCWLVGLYILDRV